jgi:hypothetical protein
MVNKPLILTIAARSRLSCLPGGSEPRLRVRRGFRLKKPAIKAAGGVPLRSAENRPVGLP